MGLSLSSLDIPLQKTTNGLLLLSEDPSERAQKQQTACLHCGRCARVCPMGLVPQQMAEAAEKKNYERYVKFHGTDCIACGCCTYTCPAKRPLTPTFKQAKAEILERRKREGGAQK